MKEILLTQGKRTIVDDEDYEELNKFKWYAHADRNTFYAGRNSDRNDNEDRKQHTIKMHRVIMNPPPYMKIDHINGNGLDNRRENLRIVTNRQNCQNKHIEKSSKYSGVHWYDRDKRWIAQIRLNNKLYCLGSYTSEDLANAAYTIACEEVLRIENLSLTVEETDFPYNIGLPIEKAKLKTSKYKGVNWNKNCQKWIAQIRFENKHYHLGVYETEEEASHIYEVCLKYRKMYEVRMKNINCKNNKEKGSD
jgi:frataxin-like iron-binding protein CyaY